MIRDWHTPPSVPPGAVREVPAPARPGGSRPEGAGAGRTGAGAGEPGRGDADGGLPGWLAASWQAGDLERLAGELAGAAAELAGLPGERLAAAWTATVAAFRDPSSALRRELDPVLVGTTGLSPEGLAAGLEAVLGGVAGADAARLLRETSPAADASPVLVVLASNLPALAVQPLLPILARRRPAVLKSPSAEPLFAAAFVAELARREPVLGRAVAALTWRGGDPALEAPLLASAGRILAYGDAPALADLARRAGVAGEAAGEAPGERRLVGYGPKTSLAVVGPGVRGSLEAVAEGLARDVALFDQRGCLSIAAVFVLEEIAETNEQASGSAAAPRIPESAPRLAGSARSGPAGSDHEPPLRQEGRRTNRPSLSGRVAGALASALGRLARTWPPGPPDPAGAAAVRQLREEAALRGLALREVEPGDVRSSRSTLTGGTVVVEPLPAFRPTPGLRTVRVHPLAGSEELEVALAGWAGRLQGAALAGLDVATEERVHRLLHTLGVSRIAPPGRLQAPDVRWHNGGIDPLAVLE